MTNYLKGIYYAVLGRVDVKPTDFTCRPEKAKPVDTDEFFEKVDSEYSEVLEVLAA